MSETIDCAYSIEGEGPPLFLIHGIGAARDVWRFLVPTLRDHFTVVRHDLRGHGESPKPVGESTLDDLVADVERLRERCGFERAHFAGHSLGGMIAPAYARRYPERVLSLGLLSTAAGRTADDSAKVIGLVQALEKEGIENLRDGLSTRWFTDEFVASRPEVVDRRLQQILGTDPGSLLNVFRIYATTEMLPWLHEIEAPSLVLTGENDGGCNPWLNRLIADALPHSELVILPHLKHAILLEAPEEVAGHLIRFMEPHSP